MDTSPRYQGLCAKAEDVQSLWSPRHGDFFLGEKGRVECWVHTVHSQRRVKQGFGISRLDEKVVCLTPYTWLPRLDQLMEMAQVRGRRFESVSQEFFTWNTRAYAGGARLPREVFTTLEQVWLAFVMQNRFDKIWTGSAWKLGNTS